MTGLTGSQRKYLCAIHTIENEKKAARIKDIAQILSLGAAAVSEAVKKLSTKNFVNYEPYGVISLTEAGKKSALETIKMKKTVEKFLLKVPEITPEEAAIAASDISSLLAPNIIKKIEHFVNK